MQTQPGQIKTIIVVAALALGIIGLAMWGLPKYSVYKRELYGQAELKQAEWNRQIVIQEAEAKKEAAKSWAQAEIERARGAAEANKIVGEYLGGPDAYLRWLFIEQLDKIQGQIIYLPTEAAIPILEAGKRQQGSTKPPPAGNNQ